MFHQLCKNLGIFMSVHGNLWWCQYQCLAIAHRKLLITNALFLMSANRRVAANFTKISTSPFLPKLGKNVYVKKS